MIRLLNFHFKSNSILLNWIYTVLFILIISVIDYLSGPEILLSVFYVVPVGFASWFLGRKAGFRTAIISEVVWLITDFALRNNFEVDGILIWNAAIRLFSLLLASFLFSRLHEAIKTEHELALVDGLTGLTNGRGFRERTNVEIERMVRSGELFTMVYFDLDNFKAVNDTFGHQKGDELLRAVADIMVENLRKVDIPARLGGDEFAILLTNTEADGARIIIGKIKQQLDELMKKNKWPVTASFGALSFETVPSSVNEMITLTDQLMYTVKNSGKNNIAFDVYKKTHKAVE
ncbi:MAG: GGDEF domain-containing protein [Bacteroidetes bacterium]|nr:GGDEF domain-containing protein [Bacteroidota bacterium]